MANPKGYMLDTSIVEPGIVFQENDLIVEAFNVPHGMISPAYGYKITTSDKTIAISGDTSFSEEVARQSIGADFLFQEVLSEAGLSIRSEEWQNYHNPAHTVSSDVAAIAKAAKPSKLILYHGLFFGALEHSVIAEIRDAGYDGDVVLANDLDVFD